MYKYFDKYTAKLPYKARESELFSIKIINRDSKKLFNNAPLFGAKRSEATKSFSNAKDDFALCASNENLANYHGFVITGNSVFKGGALGASVPPGARQNGQKMKLFEQINSSVFWLRGFAPAPPPCTI